ncbi:restriction endonuclease fold toxin 5 domain-containing protein [Burkholderia pyrrocinia]|uniref:restriction endonuclease fold toxin 5 domain-containing protein n=1 Tax=Burkholderia pyrrocinia TaxID=60550 RepID=UPI00158C96A1|nr:restriction endonuclease fold toxin 5 domain-containing protein [Burkholderia pyrrocinia]
MAAPLIPLAAAAATEIGPVLSAIGGALLGGTAVAGVASMSGSTAQKKEDAQAKSRTISDSTNSCKKCPPETTGMKVRNNHGVNWPAYQYQARVTGFAFDTEGCHWSEEWKWLGTDYDGFRPEECLLQEAKGNYDQFLDGSIPKAADFFKGWDSMVEQAISRSKDVKANPPTRLRYYFQGQLTYQRMSRRLKFLRIESEYFP